MLENTKLLLLLFRRPAAAMSLILDRGSLLFPVASVVILSWLLRPRFPFSFYTPLLVLAVVYVPGVLLLSKLLARTGGSMGTVFQRDYAPLLTCTAMAWSATNLPLAAGAWLFPGVTAVWLAWLTGAVYLYFLVLMFFAVRTVYS